MKKSDKVLFDKLCKLLFIIITCYLLYYFFFKRKPVHEGLTDVEKTEIFSTEDATYKDKVGTGCLHYNATYKGAVSSFSTSAAVNSWKKCAKKCKDTPPCKGFTYERSTKKCSTFDNISKGTVYKYSPKYTYTEHKGKVCRDIGFPSADHLTEAVCTLANGLCDKDKLGWTPQKKAGKEFGYPADGAAAAAGVGGELSSACPYLPYIPNEYTKHEGYTGNTTGTKPHNVCSGDTCPANLGWTPKKKNGKQNAGTHCPYFPAGDDTDAKRDITIKKAQKYCDSDTECTGITEYSGGTYVDKQQICFRKGPLSPSSVKIQGTNIYIKGEPSDANIQPYIDKAKQACSNIPQCKGIYVAKKGGFICFNKTVDKTKGTNAQMNCHIRSSTKNSKYGIVSGKIAGCYDKYPPTTGTTAPCTCTNGTPATGAKCTTPGAEICSACGGDYTLSTTTKKCDAKAGTNPCTCSNGTPATGAACTTQGAHICKTCNANYKIDTSSGRCVGGGGADTPCTCTNGTPATGAKCTTPGAEICGSCEKAYEIGDGNESDKCVKRCTCTNGEAVTASECTTPGAHICDSCREGYGFGGGNESDKCVKICTCTNGEPATGTECRMPGAHICESCEEGYGFGAGNDKCVKICKCRGGYPAKGAKCPKKGQQKCVVNPATERECKKGFTFDGEECSKCGIFNIFDDCG